QFQWKKSSWPLRAVENKSGEVSNLRCHSEVVDAFWEKCFHFGKVEAALRYVYVLANLCELRTIPVEKILLAIETTCTSTNQ
ncbi:hypothetical protein, partial [Salmonella sp. s51933]|uniref:hypothetical protein n=1 Tax=Salmonella sp. s51933 TaxID=3160127 RepID=UPI0037548A0C